MIDLKELQKDIMDNRHEKGFGSDVVYDFCRAFEELAEAFAKYNKGQTGVAEEFADVTIFLLGMSNTLGFDLEKELLAKIEKNRKREYRKEKAPDGRDVFIRIRTDEDP